MKYNVHIYATVRVLIQDVEAADMKAATETAEKAADLQNYPFGRGVEYADEVTAFLVDVVGDEEYEQSQSFDMHQPTYEQLRGLARTVALMVRDGEMREGHTEVYEQSIDDAYDTLGSLITRAREITGDKPALVAQE